MAETAELYEKRAWRKAEVEYEASKDRLGPYTLCPSLYWLFKTTVSWTRISNQHPSLRVFLQFISWRVYSRKKSIFSEASFGGNSAGRERRDACQTIKSDKVRWLLYTEPYTDFEGLTVPGGSHINKNVALYAEDVAVVVVLVLVAEHRLVSLSRITDLLLLLQVIQWQDSGAR